MKQILIIISVLLFAGFNTIKAQQVPNPSVEAKKFTISEISIDKTYGYTQDNPIKVGDGNPENGVRYEHMYLRALAGPNGEPIKYRRLGSCCDFETPNGLLGIGLLDKYQVTYEGLSEPIILYINMYDSGKMYIPYAFTSK